MESDRPDPANVAEPLIVGNRITTIVAIAAVGVAVSLVGAIFIVTDWSSQQQRDTGILRGGVFVAVMAAVCVVGYRLYVNQSKPNRAQPQSLAATGYLPALKSAFVQQCIFLVLGALMLDMGEASHITTVAAIAHWAVILLIICRRPRAPTQGDLLAIRWGYMPIMVLVATVGPQIWRHFGRW
jgi:hypothetical protein